MRLSSRARLTIAAGVVAATGFAILGFRELARPEAHASAPAARASVSQPAPLLFAVATRAIRTGETISADMIRAGAAAPGGAAVAALPAEAIGKVATRDIPANTLVARAALGSEAKLAIRVPLGMRAISIDTTAEIAVAGLLRPGDRVDVQVVYPGADAISGARGQGRSQAQTLLQMVQVLAVGDTVLGTEPAGGTADPQQAAVGVPGTARTVTLALYPEQVSQLSLARSTGALHLSLRNPGDEAQPAMASAVSGGPLPVQAAPAALVTPAAPLPRVQGPAALPPARPRSRPHSIDLVVGGNHAIIYSGSDEQ